MTAAKQVEHFVWEPSGKATIDGYDLAELAKKVRCGLRIDPQLSKPYYDKVISTYKEKFGLPISQAEDAVVEIAKLPGIEFRCIMTHIGSQIFTPSRYLTTLEKIFDLV